MEKAMTGAKIEVKKLEWELTEPGRFGAHTVCGLYEVMHETVGVWAGRWVIGRGGLILEDKANEQEAKNFAQAHFESLIRSAIVAGTEVRRAVL
jgi:hypothetical protein